MGNTASAAPDGWGAAVVVRESENTMASSLGQDTEDSEEQFHDINDDCDDDQKDNSEAKKEEMNKFKKELSLKREQRKEILARHRAKKMELEKSLEKEKKSKLELLKNNKMLRDLLLRNNIEIPEVIEQSIDESITETIVEMREEFEILKTNNNTLRKDLVEANKALQGAYTEMADLSGQNTEAFKQINALKQVVSVSKTMINLREEQLTELKKKLNEIEQSLVDKEANLLSNDLRQEYERQLENIRTLRGLYEERARLAEVTRLGLVRDLEEQRRLLQIETNRCTELSEKVEGFEEEVKTLQNLIENKNDQISSSQDQSRSLKEEMSVIHKLFSQVLLGYQNKQDLDKLVHRLEENHGLLTHMAEREDDVEASSALPKLLLELVNQVDESDENTLLQTKEESNEIGNTSAATITESAVETSQTSTAEEIVENLPKVWRVLMELLSHQNQTEVSAPDKVTTCYKSVETNSGPVLVPSVSQTYIRLKDLIVEKLGLVKEVNRMKQLNSHLESRLEGQERRLCLVTTELSKTWHVVGRLRRHHQQLHTHEKILKYELQQKRKLLNELKDELEYCREKWEQAREKNTQSEKDWHKLRAEFASRKPKANSPLLNNSAESGYSDERPSEESSESNDESEYISQSLIKCKKKFKKSFETILDSSSDFNLAAEREDPASEMLDVADLPLDTQDGDENQEISTCSSEKTENLQKEPDCCDESGDELCEISNEIICGITCENNEPISTNSVNDNKQSVKIIDQPSCSNSEMSSTTINVDPAAILRSIQEQNERLAKKDKKLESLEKTGDALLKQTQETVNLSHKINETLDHILYRSTASNISNHTVQPAETCNDKIINENADLKLPEIDFKAILESVKKQDKMIENKEERLRNLETNCKDVVSKISNTLHASESMIEKIEILHNGQNAELETSSEKSVENFSGTLLDETSNNLDDVSDNEQEPSTSGETDHEARFAARDLRFKRLEEQTKCLMNKVNITNSKGIKIHYKLEELHNIYGSEGSRAGTPCDDSDDITTKNDSDSADE